MIKGVYIIQSISNPMRVYVGSSVNIKHRKQQHFTDLRRNEHGSSKLQHHFNKYGEDDLIFDIIESGDYFNNEHLLSREQGWFYHFREKDRIRPYFNMLDIAGNSTGRIHSEETRRKISEIQIGKTMSEKTRKKMSLSHIGKNTWTKGRPSPVKGIKKSEQAKKNMSEGRTGMKFSDSHIESLVKSHIGVKHKSTPKGKDHGQFGKKRDFWYLQNSLESRLAGKLIKEMEEKNKNENHG